MFYRLTKVPMFCIKGTPVHEETSWKAFESVWKFIETKWNDRVNSSILEPQAKSSEDL